MDGGRLKYKYTGLLAREWLLTSNRETVFWFCVGLHPLCLVGLFEGDQKLEKEL